MINYLWEYLYSKFKQEAILTASQKLFAFVRIFLLHNRKSWQWYITCGNSVRRKRTRITMRSRVVLSVLFLRLDLMFVGPWIRVCEIMSCEEVDGHFNPKLQPQTFQTQAWGWKVRGWEVRGWDILQTFISEYFWSHCDFYYCWKPTTTVLLLFVVVSNTADTVTRQEVFRHDPLIPIEGYCCAPSSTLENTVNHFILDS